jgi:L-ornithine Nalpha-acyltransferase
VRSATVPAMTRFPTTIQPIRQPLATEMEPTRSTARIEVRLARTDAELEAAQRLRYRVFYEEWGAQPDSRAQESRRDRDAYDAVMEHLIVIDHARSVADGQVVGNYRLLRRARLGPGGRFYSSAEFDIAPLLASGQRLLELGRSCVLREYRNLPILQRLWRALAAYVADHRIEIMFGCASLHGADPAGLREQLAYLHHHHLAPLPLRPRAIGDGRIGMDVADENVTDPRRARSLLEPIIRGYLRLGASVGEGAYIDRSFNAVDVCIVMPTAQLTRKYLRHYERGLQRRLVADDQELPGEVAEPRHTESV